MQNKNEKKKDGKYENNQHIKSIVCNSIKSLDGNEASGQGALSSGHAICREY